MNRRVIHRGRIATFTLEDEKWEIIEHKPAVGVLAVQDGKMLFVRQYRPAIRGHTLEIPAGLVEPGEDTMLAAAREFSEECNLGGELRLLTRFYSSPGFTDEFLTLYEASDLRPVPGTPDADEDIELVWMAPQAFLDGVLDGSILTSGPGVVAALHALRGV